MTWQLACLRHRMILNVVSLALMVAMMLPAQTLGVKYREGTLRGFLVLRTLEGRAIASGDVTQISTGDRVTLRLTFHFTDGSLDDETAVYTQNRVFRLLTYRHVQKGPSFPEAVDLSLDTTKRQTTVRYAKDGKEKVDTDTIDLPVDLVNGLLPVVLKNLPTDAADVKVSFLAATPKPRMVKLLLQPEGEESFTAAGTPHKAFRYRIKVELGGVAGVVAPVIGKQPKDLRVWILRGVAPAFLRLEGQLYAGGPVWRIEQTAPVFPH